MVKILNYRADINENDAQQSRNNDNDTNDRESHFIF